MAKIITVTANTAIDLLIDVAGLNQDTIKAQHSEQYSAGKGINVGKAIANLGETVLCQGFVGKQSLPIFNAIDIAHLETELTTVDGKTRTNLTLTDTQTGQQTHIITQGFSITDQNCQQLFKTLAEKIQKGDSVVLSGSLPPGAPDDLYAQLIQLCHSKQAIPYLDTSGTSLKKGITAQPFLIKPNQSEFQALTGTDGTNEGALLTSAQKIINQGIQWVCISRGEQGALIIGKHQALSATIKYVPGKILTTVGCGDALLAGLVVAFQKHQPLETAIKLGIACATANLLTPEPGQIDTSILPEIIQAVEIRWLTL